DGAAHHSASATRADPKTPDREITGPPDEAASARFGAQFPALLSGPRSADVHIGPEARPRSLRASGALHPARGSEYRVPGTIPGASDLRVGDWPQPALARSPAEMSAPSL